MAAHFYSSRVGVIVVVGVVVAVVRIFDGGITWMLWAILFYFLWTTATTSTASYNSSLFFVAWLHVFVMILCLGSEFVNRFNPRRPAQPAKSRFWEKKFCCYLRGGVANLGQLPKFGSASFMLQEWRNIKKYMIVGKPVKLSSICDVGGLSSSIR